MSTFVPGYVCDVFISYRLHDNRSGWVTEFVKSLEEELATIVKGNVTVYCDFNPHDGLRETYDVDESLKQKLKSAIFIPVLSQTYCDATSFAWRHEFLVFKKTALSGQPGLKIKLANQNITSRILPVRIHDLDEPDKALLESEIGPIRAIDFIFRSTGVNRPLRAHEDLPLQNLNNVLYRDQINKLANAVKEILTAMRIDAGSIPAEPKKKSAEASNFDKALGIGIGLFFAVAFALYFLFFRDGAL